MKLSVKKETHDEEQPIRVLKHNLTTRLVERNEEYITLLQSKYILNNNIKYHIAGLPLINRQIPFINEKGIINLRNVYVIPLDCMLPLFCSP